MRTNTQHSYYTRFNGSYQLVLPLNLETLIPEDDSVRLLSQILEGLNYQGLYKAYSSKGRKPAVEPKLLFKVLTYAYMNNIYSSRKIETACKRDINFMWLLEGNKCPDHSTIARFRKIYLSNAVEDLFYQFILHLKEIGEVKFENLFIDGTKIEANANKYTFVWDKVVKKNEAKMFDKVQNFLRDLNEHYSVEFIVSKERMLDDLNCILSFLKQRKEEGKVEFVYGIGKRKSKLQKFTEEVQSFYERQVKYDSCNEIFQGRSSYSKTDTGATFMRMKDDHMRNSQLKPGYNLQIGVESEYIVSVGVFQNRSDIGTLIPFLGKMEERLKLKYKNIIADSGYESEENYLFLEKKGYTYYIKPQTYDRWKKRSFKKDISKRENMVYDSKLDEYTCHNNKKLKATGKIIRTSVTGYKSEATVYECEDCTNCQFKPKCTKAQGNKKLQVSKKFIEKRQISYQNIVSKNGVKLRVNRSIQAEGAFGVLKQDYGFQRFLTRGIHSVSVETLLLGLGYNMNKLHAKLKNGRCGHHLHELKVS
ncbi:IS1182 family transposase [Alkalicella caledoniensis]|uniref:IS1182 family transposase n=1 Tax=Alkalicella caledoniensis TaxID=2731377 RepID=A0A7G9W6E5_ALKCA|nr:IS1182 family transposase [Alkalicella caledoniensis]QNO13724.1 IS1182 family transposase [Alkalicella caledoniensis]QNO14257.1 IS1182 family transposase [Alkalicella caledoniensis]QNO15136.1 IS1182 family transposase [Alkalicella caledoniensis]